MGTSAGIIFRSGGRISLEREYYVVQINLRRRKRFTIQEYLGKRRETNSANDLRRKYVEGVNGGGESFFPAPNCFARADFPAQDLEQKVPMTPLRCLSRRTLGDLSNFSPHQEQGMDINFTLRVSSAECSSLGTRRRLEISLLLISKSI